MNLTKLEYRWSSRDQTVFLLMEVSAPDLGNLIVHSAEVCGGPFGSCPNTSNSPPSLVGGGIPDLVRYGGQSINLDLLNYFSDNDGDTFSLLVLEQFTSILGKLPSGISFDSANNRILGTLAKDAIQGSPYKLAILADDGNYGTTTAPFEIVIQNRLPIAVESVSEVTAKAGRLFSLDMGTSFIDRDGDELAFTATNLPQNFSINETTGVISGTYPPSMGAKTFNVDITARDGRGGSTNRSLTIHIEVPTKLEAPEKLEVPKKLEKLKDRRPAKKKQRD